ncbi:TetR/AcrR family transcriptional regulator [Nocardia violaceofusca]|uniref:TetR/AcrR family transcriptional regulator n=1 Tax=Nocardia violaceofusca TaxID=941182 RepID=UPI0007A39E81|nr:TetR/AcrR family transcriptional regulator [Nocardia violaceofusca]
MPKIVDRTQRRDEVAAALWRLAHREGWNAVSLRRVAAEAGLSLGSLQHYFAGMDDLLDYSVGGVVDMLDERLVEQLTTLADPRDAESTVRRVLRGMIPGTVPDPAAEQHPDDSWRIQVMAWLAVVTRAARNPEMSARLSAGSDRLAEAIAAILPATRHSRDDALSTARGLLSLVEGLLLQLARGDIDPARASTVITHFVALAFDAPDNEKGRRR